MLKSNELKKLGIWNPLAFSKGFAVILVIHLKSITFFYSVDFSQTKWNFKNVLLIKTYLFNKLISTKILSLNGSAFEEERCIISDKTFGLEQVCYFPQHKKLKNSVTHELKKINPGYYSLFPLMSNKIFHLNKVLDFS